MVCGINYIVVLYKFILIKDNHDYWRHSTPINLIGIVNNNYKN